MVMLVSAIGLGIPTLVFALDWVAAASPLGYEFYAQVANDMEGLGRWFVEATSRFDGLRGNVATYWLNWIILLIIAAMLFLVDYSRFLRPSGSSLLADERSQPVAARMLERFGYFEGIRYGDVRQRDFFAMRRVMFAPRPFVSRIISGRPSEQQQATLRFYMAHEFVHVLFRDNLAHSLFRLVFFWLTAVIVVFAAFFVFPTSLISSPTSSAPLAFGFAFVASLAILYSIGASCYGVALSYMKLREFHADDAAYNLVGREEGAYGDEDEAVRPGMFSAWSRSISRYERKAHRLGTSLHARNLIPFALVFHAGLRSLYMLVAPPQAALFVLAFDLPWLLALVIEWRRLPRRIDAPKGAPLAPWVVACIALVGLTLSMLGLSGYISMVLGVPLREESFRLLQSWPLLIEMLFSIGVVVTLLIRRWRKGKMEAVARTRIFRRIWLGLLVVPGFAFGAALLFALLVFGSGALTGTLAALPDGPVSLAIGVGLTVLFFCAAALVYRNLLVPQIRLFVIELVLTSVALFALISVMTALMLQMTRTIPDFSAEQANAATVEAILHLEQSDILAGAVAAAIVIAVYISSRLIEFGARGKLSVLQDK